MKKVLAILLTLAMVVSVLACAAPAAQAPAEEAPAAEAPVAEAPATEEAPAEEPAAEPAALDIAMVTDVGNIDDQSFNQFTWEGTKQWADANGAVANYYRPSEDSDEARIETIRTAIDNGANVIVCPGYLFAASFQAVPADYPEVTFVGIDMGLGDVPEPTANTVLVTYKEEQAGYLAGYAAVKDGYTKLAFLGGMAVPAVVRYGEGFVQGANAAAVELGNTADVEIKYWYSGTFGPSDDIRTKTAGWYTEGTEIIFACGGGIVFSAIASADETADGKIIGVDVDQAYVSERIVTSAMKALANSVQTVLTALNDNGGTLPADYAGQAINLGAAEDSVGLPTAAESWKFNTFTVEEYEALFASIVSGDVTISNDIENHPAVEITVDYQE